MLQYFIKEDLNTVSYYMEFYYVNQFLLYNMMATGISVCDIFKFHFQIIRHSLSLSLSQCQGY